MKLTPTEDLMVETLLARLRLGEAVWTFEQRHWHTAATLHEKGLVTFKKGIIEKTMLVWPTGRFRDEFMDGESPAGSDG